MSYTDKDVDLPFLYIDDILSETIRFLLADRNKIGRGIYNISSFSLTPESIIKELYKDGKGDLKVETDFRNEIAKSWPGSIDFS